MMKSIKPRISIPKPKSSFYSSSKINYKPLKKIIINSNLNNFIKNQNHFQIFNSISNSLQFKNLNQWYSINPKSILIQTQKYENLNEFKIISLQNDNKLELEEIQNKNTVQFNLEKILQSKKEY